MADSKDVSQYIEIVSKLEDAVLIFEYNGTVQQDAGVNIELLNVLKREKIDIDFCGLPYVQVRSEDSVAYEMQSEQISQGVKTDDAPAARMNKEPRRGMSIFIGYGRITEMQQDNSMLLRVYVYNNRSGEMADVRAIDVVKGEFL